jgi:hypothetical protein
MIAILLAAAINCPDTEIKNLSSFPLNAQDLESLKFNENKCKDYYKNRPCLAVFTKIGEFDYHYTCEPEVKEK